MDCVVPARSAHNVQGATFRQTPFGPPEVEWLQTLIVARPQITLATLASEACEKFGWRRCNGEKPIASFVAFLRRIERRGLVQLPRARRVIRADGKRARHVNTDHAEMLSWLGPIPGMVEFQPSGPLCVRPIAQEEWVGFRLHLQRYHYLGFGKPVGESICYAALLGDELVALLAWGAAALHNGPRDRYIGWDAETRRRKLLWVVNNRRFLMLPWIRQPHLASRVLAANLRRLSRDWEATYQHPVLLAETFVDKQRFKGTCYRASNWVHLGETRGFSRTNTKEGFQPNDCPKAVFVYPLHRHARRELIA